jgi:hypothetical protein
MMVVFTGGVDQLMAGLSITEFQARDQALLGEQLEDPVDAGPRHALIVLAQPVLDLQRGQGAPLAGQQVNHRVASASLAVSSLIEYRAGVL